MAADGAAVIRTGRSMPAPASSRCDHGGGGAQPRRDLPIGILASLVVCTLLSLAVAVVLSGIVPLTEYRSDAASLPGVRAADATAITQFLNAPVAFALALVEQDWAAYLVSARAVAGIRLAGTRARCGSSSWRGGSFDSCPMHGNDPDSSVPQTRLV